MLLWLWDGTTWSQSSVSEDLMGNVEGLADDETRNLVIVNVVTGGKLVSTGSSLAWVRNLGLGIADHPIGEKQIKEGSFLN